MSYIVLGLGMLVSAIGAYAMYSGFKIVEIERGWATAIVGAVLFSGGLTAIAVALAIRTLEKLKDALRTVPTSLAAAPGPVPQPAAAPLGVSWDEIAEETRPPEDVPRPAAIEGPRAANRRKAKRGRDAMAAAIVPSALATGEGSDFSGRQEKEKEPIASLAADEHDTPILSHQPNAAESAPEPAMDAWLEESFADLDHPRETRPVALAEVEGAAETAPVGLAAEAASSNPDATVAVTGPVEEDLYPADAPAASHETEAHEVAAYMPASDQQASYEQAGYEEAGQEPARPEPASHEPADHEPSPHATEPPKSAVIGRYESEGTSYVMYADGSIEAQSEAGVYRFASMAELKAFIEG